LPVSKGGTGLSSPGASGNLLRSNGTGWESWTPNYLTSEVDGIIGNEVVGAADSTLVRSGTGTASDPYKLAINLANANTWTGLQTFAPITSAPFAIGSANTGLVTNLNADMLDGLHSTSFALASHTHALTDASITGVLPVSKGGTGLSSPGSAGNLLRSNGTGWESWTPNFLTSEVDGIIGNEVIGASDTTLIRSGTGTASDPYKLAINLANANTWTGLQTFDPSSGSVPFLVGASKTGVVTNLNADMLDGLHSTSFALASHTHALTDDSITGILPASKGGTGLSSPGPQGNLLRSNGTTWESWTPNYLTSEVDGIIGNEVIGASDTTLIRSGTGTASDPYKLGINLANANVWAGRQTFSTDTYFPGGIWSASGSVGIGATTPNAKLYVKTTDMATVPFQVDALVSGWTYRRPITVSNTGGALTDYQVLVSLDTASLISAGKMRSDCGDIRFTDSDRISLLNYWIESPCNSASTKIWVKVPSIPASSSKAIYVYYGNPSATSASNGSATFDWFDDFSSNTLANYDHLTGLGWHPIPYGTSGSCTFSYDSANQRISFSCPDNYMSAISPKTVLFPNIANLRVRFKVLMSSFSDSECGISIHVRYSDISNTYYIALSNAGDESELGKRVGGTDTVLAETNFTASTNVVYTLEFQASGSTLRYLRDGAVVASVTDTSLTSAGRVLIYPSEISGWLDEIIIGRFTSPEPTISVGTEEAVPPLQQTVFYIQNSTGNVGIGTTTPSRKLWVNGDAGGTTGWYNDSDERLKKNITEIEDALDKVMRLRGVYFEWMDTSNHPEGRQIGLIGQEVKDVVPEVVGMKDGYYQITYANLVALLVQAMKEQQGLIEEQQRQMKHQQGEIDELKARIDILEGMLYQR
jgi:hypothetical protein